MKYLILLLAILSIKSFAETVAVTATVSFDAVYYRLNGEWIDGQIGGYRVKYKIDGIESTIDIPPGGSRISTTFSIPAELDVGYDTELSVEVYDIDGIESGYTDPIVFLSIPTRENIGTFVRPKKPTNLNLSYSCTPDCVVTTEVQ